MVSHLAICKALFGLTNCPQKHQNATTHKHQHHNTINTYKKMPTLVLLQSTPPLLKCAKRKGKHVTFTHFHSQITFTSIKYIYLLPGRMPPPCFNFWSTLQVREEAPPPPPARKEPQVLHHYKSKEPSVNTWLTHQWAWNSMQSTYHTFSPCH